VLLGTGFFGTGFFGTGRRAGPGVVVGLRRLDLAEVRVRPADQLPDRVEQRLSQRGELVVDARRDGGLHGPGQDPVALQPAQRDGEHPGGDAVDAAEQFAEPPRPGTEPVDDIDGPLVADPVEHRADPAGGRRESGDRFAACCRHVTKNTWSGHPATVLDISSIF
jgi:hypothetical protein